MVNEFRPQFQHSLQQLTMPTNVPINPKIDNLKNAETWPVKFSISFLIFNFKRVYLFCLPSDFSDLSIKIQVRLYFIQNQNKFENQTIGFCSIVYQTSGVF